MFIELCKPSIEEGQIVCITGYRSKRLAGINSSGTADAGVVYLRKRSPRYQQHRETD